MEFDVEKDPRSSLNPLFSLHPLVNRSLDKLPSFPQRVYPQKSSGMVGRGRCCEDNECYTAMRLLGESCDTLLMPKVLMGAFYSILLPVAFMEEIFTV